MKSRLLFLAGLFLLSGQLLSILAQDAELSLYDRITAMVEKQEPEWKLNRKAIVPGHVAIRWASDEGRSLVSVALLASGPAAEEALKARVDLVEHIPEKKTKKSELKDVGDEGYLLMVEGGGGVNIIFRKGDCMVEVFGPSEEVARRFARHVLASLPTSNKGMNATALHRDS